MLDDKIIPYAGLAIKRDLSYDVANDTVLIHFERFSPKGIDNATFYHCGNAGFWYCHYTDSHNKDVQQRLHWSDLAVYIGDFRDLYHEHRQDSGIGFVPDFTLCADISNLMTDISKLDVKKSWIPCFSIVDKKEA